MTTITLFAGATGLNTVSDPVRIPFSPDSGYSDLAAAVNIAIKQDGRPGRRKGYTSAAAGKFHSLWSDGGDCFVMKNHGAEDALYRVAIDLSLIGLRSALVPGARVTYAQDGPLTYYSNGFQNGMIEGAISGPWPTQDNVAESNRTFSDAPVGNHIAIGHGRMFIAERNIVWWSEPYKYGLFDLARAFWRFHSDIVMLKPVDGGVYVSDERTVWFMAGQNPAEAQQVPGTPYPAIEYTLATEMVNGAEIGFDGGWCALWATTEGACLGTAQGAIVNLNRDKVIYRPATTGAGLLQGYNYIHTMF